PTVQRRAGQDSSDGACQSSRRLPPGPSFAPASWAGAVFRAEHTHPQSVFVLAVLEYVFTTAPFHFEPNLLIATHCGFVFGNYAQCNPVQIQTFECVVHHQPGRILPNTSSPELLFPNQDPEHAAAVYPVNRPQLDVAEMLVRLFVHDGEY